MPGLTTDGEVCTYIAAKGTEHTAEFLRYPHLFPAMDGGQDKTVLIVGSCAKRLPTNIDDADAQTSPLLVGVQERHANEYGFGIGRMAAIRMAPHWNVIGTYHGSEPQAKELELMLRSRFGGNHQMQKLDATDPKAIRPLLDQLVAEHGPVQAVIYAPSVQRKEHHIKDFTQEDYDTCMIGNCYSYVHLINGLVELGLAQPDEQDIALRVAYVGSVSGRRVASPDRIVYCISKAAGMEATVNLSVQYPEIMAFNFITSVVDTARTVDVRDKYARIMARHSEIGRMLTADEVAERVVLDLIHEPGLHGQDRYFTGGLNVDRL